MTDQAEIADFVVADDVAAIDEETCAPTIDTRRLWTTVVERWWNADASGLFARRFTPLDLLKA